MGNESHDERCIQMARRSDGVPVDSAEEMAVDSADHDVRTWRLSNVEYDTAVAAVAEAMIDGSDVEANDG